MSQEALSWADFFTNGSLIDMDASQWDGLLRLLPEDLGIARTDAVKSAITFGHERLVPKDSLMFIRGVVGLAREAIDESTIPFKLVPGSRFLPKNRRESLNERLTHLKGEFDKQVNDFLAKYEQIRADHRPVLKEALEEASTSALAAAKALERIEGCYPSAAELREKFQLEWRIFSIAEPKDGTPSEQSGAIMKEIENMVDRLRQQLTEKVKDIMELAGRGGKITAKTYRSALKVCERIDRLNFFADQGLRDAVEAVRRAVTAAQSSEDPGGGLTKGLETVSEELVRSREEAIASAARMMTGQAERRFGL